METLLTGIEGMYFRQFIGMLLLLSITYLLHTQQRADDRDNVARMDVSLFLKE